jgi:TPR repeat protein
LDQGVLNAIFNLGTRYFKGEGVAQDLAEAVKWYRKAAERGDAAGQFKLRECLETGQGVEQNMGAAVGWYRKAAKQGHSSAQRKLGMPQEMQWF